MSSRNTNMSNYELGRVFNSAKKVFFVGIGGISMSSLAQYCIYHGKEVFGYDGVRGEECKRLEKHAHIRYCSTTDSVIGMDLVVFSNAISEDSFELHTARAKGIPTVSRANFLAYIMSNYRVRIGVSGTHGKSTLTAMLAHIFRHAGYDPTVICGAKMKEFDAPYRFGRREYFIFEACEYMDSFLSFIPSDAVVTNIDFDHPDYFEDLGHIQRSFRKYILPAQRVFINADDAPSAVLSHPFKITYALNQCADYTAKIDTESASERFSVLYRGKELAKIMPCVRGRHNIYNALCAFAVSHTHGIPAHTIASALSSFEGIARRQELIKHILSPTGADVSIFLDYAHHPTEIRASLEGFRSMGFKHILCIFQAHTYSRTRALYAELLSSFSGADEVIIAPTYSAREARDESVSEERLALELGALYLDELPKIAEKVRQSEADCVIIMGAGDIDKLKNYI